MLTRRDAQLDRIERVLLELLERSRHADALGPRRLKTPRTISAADRRTLAALLPAWFEATKGAACRASEVAPHAPATVSTNRALGRLLSRAEGVPIDGLAVERVGTEGHVVLWRVALVVEFQGF